MSDIKSTRVEDWLLAGKRMLDAWLEELLQTEQDRGVSREMRRVCFPGRRLRPSLVLRLSANPTGDIRKSAIALELVHIASIIVDDFLDRDDGRRNLDNIVQSAGTNSILTSHHLMAVALGMVADSAQRTQNLVAAYARMCRGEYADVLSTRPVDTWLSHYYHRVLCKTTPLFELAFSWGLEDAIDPHVAMRLGRHLGQLFQMSNDLFDSSRTGRGQRCMGHDRYPLSLTLPLAVYLDREESLEYRSLLARYDRPLLSRDELSSLDSKISDSGSVERALCIFRNSISDFPRHLQPVAGQHWSWLSGFLVELADFTIWTTDYESL